MNMFVLEWVVVRNLERRVAADKSTRCYFMVHRQMQSQMCGVIGVKVIGFQMEIY